MANELPASLTRESGYVNPYANPGQNLTDWMMWDLLEEVPDLTYPLSLNVYHKMLRDDARIWSLLAAIRHPILRTSYYIDPNGARDEVVNHIAKDLSLPIRGDNGGDSAQKKKQLQFKPRRRNRFSWKAHVRSALTCLQYGHSVFEQTYAIEGEGSKARAHLRKLSARPQRTISKWQIARDGGLVAIMQDPPAGAVPNPQGEELKVDRLVVYRNEPEEGQWIGTSLLRPVYKNWVVKNELIRLEAVAIRRNGVGVPVVTAPEGIDPDPNGPAMQAYLNLVKKYRGGNTAGVALPSGALLKLLGVEGMRVDPRPAIDYHDKQIGLVALQHVLNLDGKAGSYALADVQNDPYVQAVQSILDDLLDVANEHVVEDIVDWNYSIDENAPLLVADEIGSKQDAQAAALNMLVQAELLKPDPAIRAFIRQHLGAPPEDPDAIEDDDPDDVDEPVQPSIAPAPPVAVKPAAKRRDKRAPGPDQGQLPL